MAHIFIFTARKRSFRRLCFYTCLSFCSQRGSTWECTHPPGPGTPPGQVHPLGTSTPGPGTPPRQVHPWDQVHPLGPGTPPRTRYTPRDQVHLPWDQIHPRGLGIPPGNRYTPWDQVHPLRTRYTPQDHVHSRDQVHPRDQVQHPRDKVHPLRAVHAGRYGPTSGRYASYWNAFLLGIVTLILNCFCKDAYHNHKVQFLFKLLYVLKICVQIQNLDVKSVPPDAPNSCMLSCFFTLP